MNSRPIIAMGMTLLLSTSLSEKCASQMERSWTLVASMEGHSKSINNVVFHPDGRKVFSASLDGSIRIWDTTSASELLRLEVPEAKFQGRHGPSPRLLHDIALRSDGQILFDIASEDRRTRIRFWDLSAGGKPRLFAEFPGLSGRNIALSPEGDLLALSRRQTKRKVPDEALVLELRDASTGRVEVELARYRRIYQLAFSPGGQFLAVANHRRVDVWNARERKLIHSLPVPGARGLAFSEHGRRLATGAIQGKGTVQVWDTSDGNKLAEFEVNAPYGVYAVTFYPGDENILVVGGGDGTITFWDQRTKTFRGTLAAGGKYISCIAMSEDGTLLASGGDDGILRVWRRTEKSPLERKRETEG